MTLSWQEEVRRRLRERREKAAKEPPKVSRPPRYDEVYFEGLAQLNAKANEQANKPSILDTLREAEMSKPTIKVESAEERAEKAEAEVERLRADMSDLRFDRDLQRAKVNQLIASGRDCDREWADRAIERERSLQAEMERLRELLTECLALLEREIRWLASGFVRAPSSAEIQAVVEKLHAALGQQRKGVTE